MKPAHRSGRASRLVTWNMPRGPPAQTKWTPAAPVRLRMRVGSQAVALSVLPDRVDPVVDGPHGRHVPPRLRIRRDAAVPVDGSLARVVRRQRQAQVFEPDVVDPER